MTFGNAIKHAFIKCFDFKSRSSRSEFWYFYLFTTILGFIGLQIDRLLNLEILGLQFAQEVIILGPIYIFLYFLFFIPSLSLYIRRLHDINRSGWWLLIALIPFIGIITLIFFWCLKGTQEKNTYGDATS
tara:strand:+ start:1968 stop:2357 length:390 start_codon:yes stop_codon:yes gene_type:complete